MDINEIMNRAKAAQAQALESLHKAEEKSEALAASLSPEPDASPQNNAALEAEQPAANARRQVEILGQVFDAQTMAQMAADQEQLQLMINGRSRLRQHRSCDEPAVRRRYGCAGSCSGDPCHGK